MWVYRVCLQSGLSSCLKQLKVLCLTLHTQVITNHISLKLYSYIAGVKAIVVSIPPINYYCYFLLLLLLIITNIIVT